MCGNTIKPNTQILLKQGYGSKVDVWGCGVVAYTLLGGYAPFRADDAALAALAAAQAPSGQGGDGGDGGDAEAAADAADAQVFARILQGRAVFEPEW